MKKNKIFTLSILGLLLFVPFMMPATAAPSYVPVVKDEMYTHFMDIYYGDWTQFNADGMSDTTGDLFGIDAANRLAQIYDDWDDWLLDSWWGTTIDTILPENTSDFLAGAFIPTNITYTEVLVDLTYWHIYGPGPVWPGSLIIVNDSTNFALQSLYGGMAFSPMYLWSIPFAPNTINWAVFAGTAQWGMTNYWGAGNPLAANTTVTALADGYSMFVPVAGYENNTETITLNVTYNSNGILNWSSFEYGPDLLYTFALVDYDIDAVAPEIVASPSDFGVLEGYTGQSISWTATDANPGNYTITRDATPVVTETPWTSGSPITYNITDGLTQGNYVFEITFEDMYAQTTTANVTFTVSVPDTTDPVLTSTPSDIVVDVGDTGDTFSWTATDANPGTYTITRNGTVVVSAAPWVSGTPITYDVEWAMYFLPGVTTYEITVYDFAGNSVSDTVTMTVNPIPGPSPPPAIPGFEPIIVIGIFAIGTIGLIVLKKKKK
jgi:hypothetical protein